MAGRGLQLPGMLIAAALLAATFAGPTLDLTRPTFRYVFVFDITQSMNVVDVPRDAPSVSRLDYAKDAVIESLSGLPCGTEAGVALFSGHRAFLLVTPIEICANYSELSTIVRRIDWRMTWKARSEVAKGVHKSMNLLKQLPATTRLVFFTDGHEAPPINPELPPRYDGEPGDVAGLVIGVGGATPVPIPKFDDTGVQRGFWSADEVTHLDAFSAMQNAREGITSDVQGSEHLSSLREAYLEGIAQSTGLTYARLEQRSRLARVMTDDQFSIEKTVTSDIRWMFALAALIVLMATLLRGGRSPGGVLTRRATEA
ncbi:MAG: vWA domain-containing protein [Gammaproteobacteria bacterium]|jgi:mxaL protein